MKKILLTLSIILLSTIFALSSMHQGGHQNHGDVPFKKSRMGKFCNHCVAGGGAKYTHNTNECHKYDKNGKLNKNFKNSLKRTFSYTYSKAYANGILTKK